MMTTMPTAMPTMARIRYNQRVHVGPVGVRDVVEAVSVITPNLSCGITSYYPSAAANWPGQRLTPRFPA